MQKIKLQNAEIYLKNILERIPGSIYWKDISGVYLGCNQMQVDMAGLHSLEEIIGKTDHQLPWNNVANILRDAEIRIMKTGNSEELVETPALADGTKVIMLTNKAPLYDDDGKVIGIIGTSLDITARVEAEEREKAAQLAKIAAEAHSKIDEEVKRAVMVLAGSIAHDLRTPLGTLSMINTRLKKYSPLLSSSTSAPIDASHQTMIEDFCQMPAAIEELIQNMNLYIDHNLKALKHCQEDSINEESLVMCKSYRGISNALHSYPFAPGERELIKTDTAHSFDFLGNPVLFLRILFNLINNSLYQVHKNQKGQIFIICEQQLNHNVIRVRDTAGGASAEIVAHIFDGYVTTKEKGTGVGLAFCKLTMENFGGTIECYSEEGDFIEFTLKFPKIVSDN